MILPTSPSLHLVAKAGKSTVTRSKQSLSLRSSVSRRCCYCQSGDIKIWFDNHGRARGASNREKRSLFGKAVSDAKRLPTFFVPKTRWYVIIGFAVKIITRRDEWLFA